MNKRKNNLQESLKNKLSKNHIAIDYLILNNNI